MLFVFMLGRAGTQYVLLGVGADAWIAQLIGLFFAVPLLLILARLVRLLPGKDLFQMLTHSFGRVMAYFISLLYFVYFLALAATARTQVVFVQAASLPNTPLLVLLLLFFGAAVYLARSGVLPVGKWSVLAACVLGGIGVLLTALAVSNLRLENILPMGTNSGTALMHGGHRFLVSPLGEAVVLLAFAGNLKREANPYKLFLFGALAVTLFLILSFLRDLSILGMAGMSRFRFAPFHAAGAIAVGNLGNRVDILVTISALLSGFTMAAICLLAAARALRCVIPQWATHRLVIPAAVLALGIVFVSFSGFVERLPWFDVYLRYASAVQFVIPAVMWLVAELKGFRRGV